jgi:hypothetical protein
MSKARLTTLADDLEKYETQYEENVMENILPITRNLKKLRKEKTDTIIKINNLAGTTGDARKELYKHQDKAIELDNKIAIEDKKLKEYVEKENTIVKKIDDCKKKFNTLSNTMNGGKKYRKTKRKSNRKSHRKSYRKSNRKRY